MRKSIIVSKADSLPSIRRTEALSTVLICYPSAVATSKPRCHDNKNVLAENFSIASKRKVFLLCSFAYVSYPRASAYIARFRIFEKSWRYLTFCDLAHKFYWNFYGFMSIALCVIKLYGFLQGIIVSTSRFIEFGAMGILQGWL